MNRYKTFDLIAKNSFKNPNYSYGYYDFLDRNDYTTVTMMIKKTSMNLIEEYQAYLQKGFMRGWKTLTKTSKNVER
jgi:hypothetical protein